MEYLIVRFPRPRLVLIDDEVKGSTGEMIEIEAGTHVVSLKPPNDFKPEARTILLRNTDPAGPREVDFEPA
jgi:hypothetical protein